MQQTATIVSQERVDLERVKRRIIAARERVFKDRDDWIEGSVALAEAFAEGRSQFANDRFFGRWLTQSGLDFYKAHERAALINFGSEPELAREIFSKTENRSYQLLWRENKQRFAIDSKPRRRKSPTRKSPGGLISKPPRSNRRGIIGRSMKLGDAIMAKIKDTTLDVAPEMDALIVLKRRNPELVEKLADDARAGKNVSAIAASAAILKEPPATGKALIEVFRKRMTFVWEQADHKAQEMLIDYLMHHMKES